MKVHVLLVEDDFDLAASMIEYLELEDIICDHASNGVHGVQLARENKYDVLLLDIMLPQMDGYGVCEMIRRDGSDIPVLMLTARDTLDDKIAGFEAGTDDYLVKPFAMKELLFRIRALAKRRSSQPRRYLFDDLEINTETRQARRGDVELHLAPKEWDLLAYLARVSPEVAAREDLVRAVWGDAPPESNSLKVHMHKLREKVDKPFSSSLIQTVPGVGFVLRP
jgi:DNA-binding response OmpR family regulator